MLGVLRERNSMEHIDTCATQVIRVGGTTMPASRRNLSRGPLVWILIGTVLGGLFGLLLFVSAVSGGNFASNILLGGFGLILLMLSAVAFVLVLEYRKSAQDGERN
jgi:hypothetical protein